MITLEEVTQQFPSDGFETVTPIEGSPTLKAGLAAAFLKKTGKNIDDVFDQAWFSIKPYGAPVTVQVAFRKIGQPGKPFFSDSAYWLCQSDNQADHDNFDYQPLIVELLSL